MKYEMKEILDKLEKVANKEPASRHTLMKMKNSDYRILLDYITNLEQENERINTLWKNTNVIIRNDKPLALNSNAFEYLLNLEERIDKAVKKLEFYNDIESNYYVPVYGIINILTGGDEE